MEPLAAIDERCKVCDQTYLATQRDCRNPVCAMRERWFAWNYAAAVRSGVIRTALNDYKFRDRTEWAAIFGRILVGFLDANQRLFEEVDLIVASPCYTGPGGRRTWDHIRVILTAADTEQDPSGRWPFDLADPPAVIKTAEIEPMVGKSYQERRAHAEGALRGVLEVPDPARTRGRRIVVVDDVFTDGLTLREVARVLCQEGGASEVDGVSLTRQPYGRGR